MKLSPILTMMGKSQFSKKKKKKVTIFIPHNKFSEFQVPGSKKNLVTIPSNTYTHTNLPGKQDVPPVP